MRTLPHIGSEYTGPAFDRPCERRLPPGYALTPMPDRNWLLVLLSNILAAVFRRIAK